MSGMDPDSTVARLYAIDSALHHTPPSNRSAIRQLALIPNFVVWAASWFTGPGFALGTGSAVPALGTYLELLPAVPLLGAFPASDKGLARAGLLIPVFPGFLAAAVLRPMLKRQGVDGPLRLMSTGITMGAAAGAVLGALARVSAGVASPAPSPVSE